MTTFTQSPWATEALVTELPGHISRDVVTIASGTGVVQAGTVLAVVTATGKYVLAKATGADGSQTAVAVSLYRVDATSADQPVAVVNFGVEVNGVQLIRDSSINTPTLTNAQNAQLAVFGIKVR